MKAMIVYNPAAGLHAPPTEMSEVVRLLAAEGIEVVGPKPTLGPGDATTYAREAVAQGCEAIFVAGGDGTLAQVADGLIGSATALGVLPGGTGNVFARQLNLPVAGPLHPKPMLEATRALLAGDIRRVDVGSVTLQGGIVRHFLAWSGIGFDAMVNRAVNADPERKRQLGLAAFALTAFMSLRDMAGTPTRLRVDGARANCRLLMLVVNNIQLYGVVFKMAENAVIDDGQLDVYAFQGKDPHASCCTPRGWPCAATSRIHKWGSIAGGGSKSRRGGPCQCTWMATTSATHRRSSKSCRTRSI